ncbi:hypothetical protein O4G76_11980 [Limimaricola sp. G21655-S1]|nr:hypothetical protein [Limimaricola sp. G21655-S1]MCZ4261558.1 hypothetical protein [Limimaricola sp. G21655-S1]
MQELPDRTTKAPQAALFMGNVHPNGILIPSHRIHPSPHPFAWS